MESGYYNCEVKFYNRLHEVESTSLNLYYDSTLSRWLKDERLKEHLCYLEYKVLERSLVKRRDNILESLLDEPHIIKTNLDTYLGFDSITLFVDELVRVFGGAVRDSIAGQTIKDIDIMCGPRACKKIKNVLEYNGYILMDKLSTIEFNKMYNGLHIINEPHTYIKDGKTVQIIRPSGSQNKPIVESFFELLSNVDISCCGVSWDGNRLYENYPSAVSNCEHLTFTVNNKATMFIAERCNSRTHKLTSRGWTELVSIADKRNAKLNSLLNSNYQYINEVNIKNDYSLDSDCYDCAW